MTVPLLEEQYKVKAGSPLSLPCVPPQPGGEVAVEWRHGDTETNSQDITVDSDTGKASCYCAKLHLETWSWLKQVTMCHFWEKQADSNVK